MSIRSIDIADVLAALNAANDTVMYYEGARFHRERYETYGSRLDAIADLVRRGLELSEAQYEAAKHDIAACRLRIAEIHKTIPMILVPSATGPAPAGLSSTGDARMNAPWTTLGTPAISIPIPVADGLPLGLQLTAARGEDSAVIRAAVHVQSILGVSWKTS
jgi:Asp-tRNA(Asn)/Glu-tRNA(Gln) amidotransferase A subunit family amidase